MQQELFSLIAGADPLVLITVVSVVALLVVMECVRLMCGAIAKGSDKNGSL